MTITQVKEIKITEEDVKTMRNIFKQLEDFCGTIIEENSDTTRVISENEEHWEIVRTLEDIEKMAHEAASTISWADGA